MATAEESLKNEQMLSINEFNRSSSVTGLHALARLLQSLVLMEPGTHPSIPDMGVGIKNYMFEILDDDTIKEIKQRIKKQADKFVPSNDITDIIVQKLKNFNGVENTIGLMFKIGDEDANDRIVLLLGQASNKTSTIQSKIVV